MEMYLIITVVFLALLWEIVEFRDPREFLNKEHTHSHYSVTPQGKGLEIVTGSATTLIVDDLYHEQSISGPIVLTAHIPDL